MRKREGKASARLPVPAVRAARGRSSVPDLPRYEEARRALEALHNVDDIGVVRDKAIALEEYAKVIKDPELLERAVRIKLEAWRNVGRVLREMRKAGELVKDGQRPRSSSPELLRPLADQGVSKKKGAAAEKLVALPERQFQERARMIVERALRSPARRKEAGCFKKATTSISPGDVTALRWRTKLCVKTRARPKLRASR